MTDPQDTPPRPDCFAYFNALVENPFTDEQWDLPVVIPHMSFTRGCVDRGDPAGVPTDAAVLTLAILQRYPQPTCNEAVTLRDLWKTIRFWVPGYGGLEFVVWVVRSLSRGDLDITLDGTILPSEDRIFLGKDESFPRVPLHDKTCRGTGGWRYSDCLRALPYMAQPRPSDIHPDQPWVRWDVDQLYALWHIHLVRKLLSGGVWQETAHPLWKEMLEDLDVAAQGHDGFYHEAYIATMKSLHEARRSYVLRKDTTLSLEAWRTSLRDLLSTSTISHAPNALSLWRQRNTMVGNLYTATDGAALVLQRVLHDLMGVQVESLDPGELFDRIASELKQGASRPKSEDTTQNPGPPEPSPAPKPTLHFAKNAVWVARHTPNAAPQVHRRVVMQSTMDWEALQPDIALLGELDAAQDKLLREHLRTTGMGWSVHTLSLVAAKPENQVRHFSNYTAALEYASMALTAMTPSPRVWVEESLLNEFLLDPAAVEWGASLRDRLVDFGLASLRSPMEWAQAIDTLRCGLYLQALAGGDSRVFVNDVDARVALELQSMLPAAPCNGGTESVFLSRIYQRMAQLNINPNCYISTRNISKFTTQPLYNAHRKISALVGPAVASAVWGYRLQKKSLSTDTAIALYVEDAERLR